MSGVERNAGGAGESRLLLRCWGCRGSIPSPGPASAGYGGNTSCLEIRFGDQRFVFDAGSGLRLLGSRIAAEGSRSDVRIFLTHFHWDHIQGFPFFAPLYDPVVRLDIHAPAQTVATHSLFAGQMGPVYFPVPFSAVAASIHFHDIGRDPWEGEGIRVSHFRVRHPSRTVGYRVEVAGKSLCYIPDNEMRGEMHGGGSDWRDRLVEFVGDADVLLHDSMYTEEEYGSRGGWGHSTYRDSLELALDAGVKSLYFFHHDPERGDKELNGILADYREEAERRALPVEVHAAFEGKQILFEE